jgi:acetyl-CoA carboxylase biotin carboxyl carrier protein
MLAATEMNAKNITANVQVPGDLSRHDALKSGDTASDENLIEVKSPIVGTFYASPSPGEPPFTSEGSKIKKGDPLCIIEAMKLMNKINSDHDGTVAKILVSNEEAVEYGQVIMKIKLNS